MVKHRGVADKDRDVVEQFLGSALGSPSPVNSIGVLTQCDRYWPDHAE